ncbi:MAG TPA: MBL fold metallo-hydrolase [Gemmatimonadaceae bacterium]|nr:MBL fold metallo-hydrolase [Gemmatimonadaceae bacterium]
MRLTFLGTGTSYGVPQIGCRCAVCRSTDPRDRRTRSGAVVTTNGGAQLLIDTPPELRLQLTASDIDRVDAVLFTHEHADHTHGIDDLRAISMRRGSPIPVYGPAETLASLAARFPYIFDEHMAPTPGTSRPEGRTHPLTAGRAVRIADAEVLPVEVPHGRMTVFGYRIGALAYITDAKALPDAALAAVRGAKVLVLNALLRTEHPTHLSIDEAVATAKRVGAERTFLTHLTHENRHADLEAELPPGVQPAFDGLSVRVD